MKYILFLCIGICCFWSNTAQSSNLSLNQEVDIKVVKAYWVLTPDSNYIKGHIGYIFQARQPFAELRFDMSQSLLVDSVVFHHQQLKYSRQQDFLIITWPQPFRVGDRDSVTVFYHGIPNSEGFGSFQVAKHGSSNAPILWTLSEPYGAKDWWPCRQGLYDKVDTLDIQVSTPAQYQVASNGVLVAEQRIGARKLFHWKHQYPIATYLIAVAISDYELYAEQVALHEHDTLKIHNYVYPEQYATAKQSTAKLLPVIQYFSTLFGDYPFKKEKYGHAQFGWGGGMEHQTMTFVNNFDYGLLVHELAHQWFGDKVTCGAWKYIWLNEGFATYLTGLAYEHFYEDDTFLHWKEEQRRNITSVSNGSVEVDDTTSVSRIFSGRLSYSKGAMVLNMLRWELGDSAFLSGLRHYISNPTLSYAFARTVDLQLALEQASGKSLTSFFDTWYRGQGFPSNDVRWAQHNGGDVYLRIEQRASDNSQKIFDCKLPILLKGTKHDSLLIIHQTEQIQNVVIKPGFEVVDMLVDPNVELITGVNAVLRVPDANGSFSEIGIYPNPATEKITVELFFVTDANIEIEITDTWGHVVWNKQEVGHTGWNQWDMNTAIWAKGIYFIKIKSKERVAVKKLLVE